MCKTETVISDKRLSSMTKAELIETVINQGKRLDRAKFYYRQQSAKIDELVEVNDKAIKMLSLRK